MSSNTSSGVTVAIGVFDGVHLGHRYLIDRAHDYAERNHSELHVLSFDPHPGEVLFPDAFLGLLTEPSFRTDLLLHAGAQSVHYIPFNEVTMSLSPIEFVDTYLVLGLRASGVFVGENFRFGHRAQGDVSLLKELCSERGIDLRVVTLSGDASAWSSTRIRHHVLNGEVLEAAKELGRPHRVSGIVVHGDHRGRELGYPTANLMLNAHFVVPADGVYSGFLHTDQGKQPAAISIGTNPTFDGVVGRRIEAYVIDETGLDLYGQKVNLDFIGFIRGMEAFSDIDQLLVAMERDIDIARQQLGMSPQIG